MEKGSIIRRGDLVSFFVDDSGYFSIPSMHEPIPERVDSVTHLRCIPSSNPQVLPPDFTIRCTFRIVGDKGQTKPDPITYGSIVKLIHVPTGLTVAASAQEDTFNEEQPYHCVALRRSILPHDEISAQWQVISRYRLRSEGDTVYANDYLLLKSVRYKNKYLTTSGLSTDPSKFDHLIGLQSDAFSKLGWRVKLLMSHDVVKGDVTEKGDGSKICSGDFIRLCHQEKRGHLMLRYDDIKDISSMIAPLGRLSHKQTLSPTHACGVYIREKSAITDPKSTSSVWQILCANISEMQPLASGMHVRLRHIFTGQFLCIRPVADNDSDVLRRDSSFDFRVERKRRSKKRDDGPGIMETVKYCVASTEDLDDSSIFTLQAADTVRIGGIAEGHDKELGYHENVFFMHNDTSYILECKADDKLKRMNYADYNDDIPVKGCTINETIAVLSEVFKLELVSSDEIREIMFAAKFIPLAKAAVAVLQLTPRMDELFLPLFRHFNVALYTLNQWVTGNYECENVLVSHSAEVFNSDDRETSVDDAPMLMDDEEDEHIFDFDSSPRFDLPMSGREDDPEASPWERPPMTARTSHTDGPTLLSRVGRSISKLSVGGYHQPPKDEETVIEKPKPPRVLHVNPVSSMSPWIGRGQMQYNKSNIHAPLPSLRSNTTRLDRQNILSDSRLLEILLNYAQIVFKLVRYQTLQLSENSPIRNKDMTREELEAIFRVPLIVTGCCILIQDLVHECVLNNYRNAVRIVSVKGTLLQLMRQEILGWSPPIETLLVTLKQSERAAHLAKFNVSSVLSSQDIRNIIQEMYDLYMAADFSAIHLLNLLTTLCAPGHVPDKIFQDLLTDALFQSQRVSHEAVMDGSVESHSLVFSSRNLYQKTWQVLFKVKYNFPEPVDSAEQVKKELLREIDHLKSIFYDNCSDKRGARLDPNESSILLEQLGLAGYALDVEAKVLKYADFEKFLEWWWEKRRIYFPSSSPALNRITAQQAGRILGFKSGNISDFVSTLTQLEGNLEMQDVLDPEEKVADDIAEPGFFSRLWRKAIGAPAASSKTTMQQRPAISLQRDDSKILQSHSRDDSSLFPSSKQKDDSPLFPPIRHKSIVPPIDTQKAALLQDVLSARDMAAVANSTRQRENILARVKYFDIGTEVVSGQRARRNSEEDSEADVENEAAYSGLSIILKTSLKESKEHIMKSKKQASLEWIPLRQLLARNSFERDWFRRSMLLLAELCRGNNIFAQNYACQLMPVELVLEILRSEHDYEKMIACRYLLTTYVQHDLVFATDVITCEQAVACSFDDDKAMANIMAGKVFNHLTRPQQYQALKGSELRKSLWMYIREELSELELSVTTVEQMKYHVAFLQLIRELISVGFFMESKKFAEQLTIEIELARRNGLLPKQNTCWSCFSKLCSCKKQLDATFDVQVIEKILVAKLNSVITTCRNDTTNIRKGILDYLLAQKELGKVTESEYMKTAYRFNALRPNQPIGSDHMDLIRTYFDGLFTHERHMNAIDQLMLILLLLFDVRQTNIVQAMLSPLMNPDKIFQKSILHGINLTNNESSHVNVPSNMIIKLFDRSDKDRRDYTNALFAASLYERRSILCNVYTLMYRQLAEKIDAFKILSSLAVVSSPEEALVRRLVFHFESVIIKYRSELKRYTKSPPEYLTKFLIFAFDALKSLCYNEFFPKNETSCDVLQLEVDALNAYELTLDGVLFDHDNHFEMTPMGNKPKYYTSEERMSVANMVDKYAKYSSQHVLPHTHVVMGNVVESLLESIGSIVTNNGSGFKSWDSLTDGARFYVNQVLLFFASVSCGSNILVQERLFDAVSLTMTYLWNSDGATALMANLCQYCIMDKELCDSVLASVIDRLLSSVSENLMNPTVIKFLIAMVRNHDNVYLQQQAILAVKNHILNNGAMRRYILLDIKHPTENDMNCHLHLIRLIRYTNDVSDNSHIGTIKTLLSLPFSLFVIQNNSPLQLKMHMISLARAMFTYPEIELERHILSDLKAIFHSNLQNTKDKKCYEDYFNDVISHLTRVVRASNMVKKTQATDLISEAVANVSQHRVLQHLGTLTRSVSSRLDLRKGSVETHDFISAVPAVIFFSCIVTVMLNLRRHTMLMMRFITDKHLFEQLQWLVAASCVLFDKCYSAVDRTETENLIRNMLHNALHDIVARRSKHESMLNTELFLRTEGIDAYIRKISTILLPAPPDPDATFGDFGAFNNYMDFSPILPYSVLESSPLLQVFADLLESGTKFVESGGHALMKGHDMWGLKESDELKRLSDFDKWLYGGGRYIMSMTSYFSRYTEPGNMTYTFMFLISLLMKNSISKIRNSNIQIKTRILLVQAEIQRLQRLQTSLDVFGACDLVLTIVGKSYDNNAIDEVYFAEMIPIVLKLGVRIMSSGNDNVQERFMSKIKSSVHDPNDHRGDFVRAFRFIIRKIKAKIDMHMKSSSPNALSLLPLFKVLIKIFDFCGALCSGHNDNARNFLRDQDKVAEPVNIVADVASVINILLLMLIENVKYITFEKFYERLAPYVWSNNKDIKRRFIAWHVKTDFQLMCEIMIVVRHGFEALTEMTQGPCLDNQEAALRATFLCPALLEYVGAMQLRATSVTGGFFNDRVVVWNGSNPLQFYRTYKAELNKLGRFGDDPDARQIRKFIQDWASVNKTLGRRDDDAPQSSMDILGVDLSMLLKTAMAVEASCLRFLLALLEATSDVVTENLCGILDDGVLMQNMDNLYKLSYKTKGDVKAHCDDTTVSYLTLISTKASALREDPTVIIDDLLIEWKEESAKKGFRTEDLIASIEIASGNGSVQRVYFAIPKFVRQFWPYPEVQKAKEKLLYEVSRESPEDKMADFYELMQGLIQVMRRQERLRLLLTPVGHVLFGGSNKWLQKFSFLQYFKIRPLIMVLTIFFIILDAYLSLRDIQPWIKANETAFRDFWDWDARPLFLFYVSCVHFGLCGSLFLREYMNSPAADALEPVWVPYMDIIPPLRYISKALSCWWPMCLVGFSGLALFVNRYWYAPILLDVIPQIRLMSFLLDAITRNIGRIFFTLLLAIIFLYLYAIISYIFFRNQYGLGGHSACNDIISCFKLHFDYGLTNPPEWIGEGYIDPFIGAEEESESTGYVGSIIGGSIFNFTYIILINLVLQAIISGLIIDTFGEMREENEMIENDIRDRCFICSIDRDEFEQADIAFVEHVKNEHNMWQYVWFKIYLDLKDPLSYTGPEQFASLLMTDKQNFVKLSPIKKSLSIDRKAGKVKEQYTLKAVYDAVKAVIDSQQYLFRATKDMKDSQVIQKQLQAEQDARIVNMASEVVENSSVLLDIQQTCQHLERSIQNLSHTVNRERRDDGSPRRETTDDSR